jgi:Protein of unknown function (DUF2934)
MATTSRPDSSSPKPWPLSAADLQEAVRRRAKEIYVRNGRVPGRDIQNWMQAEAEVLAESAEPPRSRTAVVVRVNGVQYTGEYTPGSADGYTPGEFAAGGPVPVRFAGGKMFVSRPNGRELETTVVGTRAQKLH